MTREMMQTGYAGRTTIFTDGFVVPSWSLSYGSRLVLSTSSTPSRSSCDPNEAPVWILYDDSKATLDCIEAIGVHWHLL